MKRIYLFIALAVSIMAIITGCGGKDKLEKEIVGVWQSEGENFTMGNVYEVSYLPSYEFLADGTAEISARITANKPMSVTLPINEGNGNTLQTTTTNLSNSVAEVEPVACTATVKGKYTIVSDKEVKIELDPSTFIFSVAPDAIKISYMNEAEKPELDEVEIKQNFINEITAELSPEFSTRLLGISDLSDIKLTDNATIISCTIGGSQETLRKFPTE